MAHVLPGGPRAGSGPGRRRSTWAVLGLTVLGVVPGVGLIAAGRRRSGITVLVFTVAAVALAVLFIGTSTSAVLDRALDTRVLREAAVAAVVLAVAWSAVIVLSHRALRPAAAGPGERVGGSLLVGVLCLAVSTPLVLGANVLLTTRSTLRSVFAPQRSLLGGGPTVGVRPTASASASAPEPAHEWSTRRLNILIIGSDAGRDRTGTRTDSLAIASIDTDTGKVLLVSVPRNLCRLAWQPGTPLAGAYPDGWTHSGGDCETSGDGDDLVNAIYNDVPLAHPDLFPASSTSNPGADALALGLQYSLGLPLPYYLLVDLDAFRELVNATGGVTVNINTPIPIGGMHDGATITQYPSGWLLPGPDRHLDGQDALWFARGRFSSDDYARIDRQKCMINAIIDQIAPATLLTRYAALAATLQNDVRTDIPESLLDPLAQLGLVIRRSRTLAGITIRSASDGSPGIPGLGTSDPDWAAARRAVRQAIAETDPTRTSAAAASPAPASPDSASPDSASPDSAAPTSGATSGAPSPTATGPSPAVSTSTAGGADITSDVASGCAYDPQVAAQSTADWKAQWSGRYDDDGHRRG